MLLIKLVYVFNLKMIYCFYYLYIFVYIYYLKSSIKATYKQERAWWTGE